MSDDEKGDIPDVKPLQTGTFIPKDPKEASLCSKVDQVNLLSFISFSWIFGYLWGTYRGVVEPCKSWTCSIFDSASMNMNRLEVLWSEELRTHADKPSLHRVIFHFMKTRLIIACIVFAFCLVFGFIGPTCLVRGLVAFVEDAHAFPDLGVDYLMGAYIVLAILAVEVSRVLLYGACWAISYRTGIRVRGALLALLYKHLMSARSLKDMTPAKIVNVCANDGQRLFDAVTFAPLVLVGPFVLIGGLIYLLKVIGLPALAGIFIFFIFDVIQAALGITMVRFRNQAIKKTEKRMNLMGEVIRCIRIIKMNAWEDLFEQKVVETRRGEQRCLKVAGYAQSLAIASGTIVPVVATIVTVLVVVATGSDLKASDAFSSITVFFVMLFGIRMIPYGLRYLAEASTSIKKIQTMLGYPTFDVQIPLPRAPGVAVLMKDCKFSWDLAEEEDAGGKQISVKYTTGDSSTTEKQPLTNGVDKSGENTAYAIMNATFTANKGELIGICGPVGSGKTSILHAVLGQLRYETGDFAIAGTTVLVPQQPFIINGTVRENILFGHPMHTQRYHRAIAASELTKDLEQMPRNEATEVGERGVQLSGGQRARISLARALFPTRDIYLLDDIFSSIDKNVANNIFKKGVKELLEHKTVFLVTSDVEFLVQCDKVIYMDGGVIQAVDTHDKLIEDNTAYREFVEHYTQPETFDSGHTSPVDSPKKSASTTEDATDTEKTEGADDEEDFGLANISLNIYKNYILAGGGYVTFSFVILAFFINVASGIFATWWLSKWMNDVHKEIRQPNGTVITETLATSPDLSYYVTVYSVSLVILFVTGLIKAMIFVRVTLTAGTNLHNGMLRAVLRGVTSFFDTTPTGRILNRFSKDMDEIDVKLPFSAEALLQNVIICTGFLVMIAYVFPAFLLACIPLVAIFVVFFLCFRAGIRSLKRTENISRSPLFSHVSSSLEGVVTIHSHSQTARFIDEFKSKLDEHSGALFVFQSAMRWQAVWLDLLVVAVTFIVSSLIVILTNSVTPADAGMALAFALQMSGIFQFAVRSQTELEAKLTAVERVSYYRKNIEPEDIEDEPPSTAASPTLWPSSGHINFQNVIFSYHSDAVRALDNVSFNILHSERVGVIGRTGAGKSSLCNALFRLYPTQGGTISVGDCDIAKVPLRRLRRAMAIIPQDPIIFADTLRFNLDPDGVCSDDQLWEVLELTGFRETAESFPEKLGYKLDLGGGNLSSGQRQMICVGRALLRNVKIVILDEATANLDSQTDQVIQACIRKKCANKTLLIITHRVQNVADAHKVLRVSHGKINVTVQKVLEEPQPETTTTTTTSPTDPSSLYPKITISDATPHSSPPPPNPTENGNGIDADADDDFVVVAGEKGNGEAVAAKVDE